MRQLILILVVTFLACLVCWKNGSHLKHLYKDLTSPQRWKRVEIVDERSLFEDLRDYSWEYLELLVVGLTACVVSFTIGWSANSIRKGYADFGDVDMLAECLGEHCALHRRIEQLEERIEELERSGHGVDPVSGEVSNIDCGGGECAVRTKGDISETTKQTHQSDYKDSCAMKCFHEPSPCETCVVKKSTCTLETLEDMTKPTICKGDIAAESISKQVELVLEASSEIDLEVDQCKLDRGDERASSRPVSDNFNEVSNECLLSSRSSSQVEISKISPTEIEMGVNLDENGKLNAVDGEVCEEINDEVSATSTRKVISEACKTKHGHSNLTLNCVISNQVESENSCCYAKTQDSADEQAVDDSEVDGNTGTVRIVEDLESRATEVDVSPSTLTIEVGPVNVARDRIPLDVSASTLTVEVVDCAGPRPDSARTRGRIPQYQKLHKDVKTAATLNSKSARTSTSTAPHQYQYVDELSLNRPSTASGDTLHAAAAGCQRKKKQKYYAHHLSNKTDAKLS